MGLLRNYVIDGCWDDLDGLVDQLELANGNYKVDQLDSKRI
jgi:hypothetical protein